MSAALPTLQEQAAQAIANWQHAPGDTAPAPRRRFRVIVVTDCQQRFEYEAVYGHSFEAFDAALARFHHCARIEAKPIEADPSNPAGDTHA